MVKGSVFFFWLFSDQWCSSSLTCIRHPPWACIRFPASSFHTAPDTIRFLSPVTRSAKKSNPTNQERNTISIWNRYILLAWWTKVLSRRDRWIYSSLNENMQSIYVILMGLLNRLDSVDWWSTPRSRLCRRLSKLVIKMARSSCVLQEKSQTNKAWSRYKFGWVSRPGFCISRVPD